MPKPRLRIAFCGSCFTPPLGWMETSSSGKHRRCRLTSLKPRDVCGRQSGNKLRDGAPARRMAPMGCDLAQRQQHEGAVLHAGMGKERRALLDEAVIIEQVEVEGAGRVGLAPLAPEGTFHLMERGQ